MSSSKEFDCDWFRYKNDAQPLGSKYRSKHFKIAAAADRERWQYVNCRLPHSLEFSARFTQCNASTECRGRLTTGTLPHSLQFIVDPRCPCWQNNEPVAEEFRCLESTFSDAGARDWMIISERVIVADSDDENIACWLLASYDTQNAIYRLTAEQCNSDRINTAQRRPVATLVEVRRGSVGWFDDVTSAAPGRGHEQGAMAGTASTTGDADDDWSFLDGSPIVNVYDEPYINTDSADDEQGEQPDAEWYRRNNKQPHNSAVIISLSSASLACVSVLLAL